MANRVILGKRGTSDYGLSVSRDGVNVADSSSTIPLSFDTNAGNSLMVHSYGQGLLLPNYAVSGNPGFTFGGVTYTATDITITTGLNYDPAYAVRFCRVSDLSSGVATQVWSPHWYGYEETTCVEEMDDGSCEEEETVFYGGGLSAWLSSNNLRIENNLEQDDGNEPNSYTNDTVLCYSYVIFHTPNFRNGASL